jgi:hypothetical protein
LGKEERKSSAFVRSWIRKMNHFIVSMKMPILNKEVALEDRKLQKNDLRM